LCASFSEPGHLKDYSQTARSVAAQGVEDFASHPKQQSLLDFHLLNLGMALTLPIIWFSQQMVRFNLYFIRDRFF